MISLTTCRRLAGIPGLKRSRLKWHWMSVPLRRCDHKVHFWPNQQLSWRQMPRLTDIQIVWSSYTQSWRTSQWALQSSLASPRATCQIGVRLGRWQVVLNMKEWVFILFSCSNNCHHLTHLLLWRPTPPRLAEILLAVQFHHHLRFVFLLCSSC